MQTVMENNATLFLVQIIQKCSKLCQNIDKLFKLLHKKNQRDLYNIGPKKYYEFISKLCTMHNAAKTRLDLEY